MNVKSINNKESPLFYYKKKQNNTTDIFFEKDVLNEISIEYGVFKQLNLSEKKLNRQGWKIHVSCFYHNYKEILNIVGNYCYKNNITFKYIRNLLTLSELLSNQANRFSSGKFITIYPSSEKNFIEIIKSLYILLKNMDGPYILTDKRYRDCKVLYYRYGLIAPEDNKNADYIISPDGVYSKDLEEHMYTLPQFIEEPFPEESISEPTKLNVDYLIEEAISITNGGGIYKAVDALTLKKVILKEARPYTGVSENLTSVYYRKKEKKILNLLRSSPYTPTLIDSFWEWEHYFLVVEFIEGISLYEYSASKGPGLMLSKNTQELTKSFDELKKIFINILNGVIHFHRKGISLGDIAPDNIIIRENNIYFIDLEDATLISEKQQSIAKKTGFYNETIDMLNPHEQDIQKLGYLFLNMFTNSNQLLELDSSGKMTWDFFLSFAGEYKLPLIFLETVERLIKAKDENLEYILRNLQENSLDERLQKEVLSPTKNLKIKIEELENTIKFHSKFFSQIGYPTNSPDKNEFSLLYGFPLINYLGNIKTKTNTEKIFHENLSISNGLSGYILFLIHQDKELNLFPYIQFFKKRINSTEDIFFRDGLSGIGYAFLEIYKQTEIPFFLEEVIAIERVIRAKLSSVLSSENTCRALDIPLGLLDGLTGVLLFYVKISESIKKTEYKENIIAIKAFLNKHDYKQDTGILIPTTAFSKKLSPYIGNGTAGLIKTLLLYMKNNRDDTVTENYIKELLIGIDTKYTTTPSLCYGLSGIGDTFLDAYLYFNEEVYLQKAIDIDKNLNLFTLEYENRVYYAGQDLKNLGLDFEKGLAGVLYFHKRLYSLLTSKNNLSLI